MSATVVLPVYLRVGADGEEIRVGSITADSAEEARVAMAAFLRGAADEIDRQAENGGAGGGDD